MHRCKSQNLCSGVSGGGLASVCEPAFELTMQADASVERRLILHIGTEKTGSTSIQTFLRLNKTRLAANGVGVPTCLGDTLHFRLQLMANDDDVDDDFIRNLRLHLDPQLRKKAIDEWRENFYQEVKTSSAHTWIISCETLHSRLLRETELKRLRGILTPLFSEISVIVYLRDPLALAISRLTEAAKSALPVVLPKPPASGVEFDICNHKQTVIRWQSLMGSDSLNVRLFERDYLIDGDVVLDFLAMCELNPADYRLPRYQNTSLSAIGLTLMEEINRHVPRRWIDGTLIESRWLLACHVLQHMRGGAGMQPSKQEVEIYRDHYESSNEWVRRHYFPDRIQLFKPYMRLERPENKTVLDSDELARIARLIANLWLTKVAQIKQLQAEVDFLQARLLNLEEGDSDQEISAPSPRWQDFVER